MNRLEPVRVTWKKEPEALITLLVNPEAPLGRFRYAFKAMEVRPYRDG